MRLATIRHAGREEAAVLTDRGLLPVPSINAHLGKSWPTDLFALIQQGISPQLLEDAGRVPGALDPATVSYGPLYRQPRKIWGIGLNYKDHADDLQAVYPTEPASFMKGDQTIIGPGDTIELPPQSKRVTAEAELGLIIGKTCRNVTAEEAPAYLAGVCLIIDMTAEDILQVNPRFLTRAKNFDTFFSFGPHLITMDEIADIHALQVGTYRNGSLHRQNVVGNMTYPPYFLVSFHSQAFTLYPGDIISTGTPGAVVIEDGDITECRIDGLGVLSNPVLRRG